MARLPVLALLMATCAVPAAAQAIGGAPLRGTANSHDQLGMVAGRFTLYPAIEISGRFSGGTIGSPGASIVLSPELVAIHDASPLTVTTTLSADIVPVATTRTSLVVGADASVDVRLDLPGLWDFAVRAAYGLTGQSNLDPLNPVGLDFAPDVHTTTATVTATGPVGGLALGLTLEVRRTFYEDGELGGVPVDQGDRNNLFLEGRARLATDGAARFTPFVELAYGRRIFDRPIGTDTFEQGFAAVELRGGVAYDSAPVLTGEVSAGYRRELPDDAALTGLRGFTFAASSTWSPREPVAITFATQTTFAGDPSPTAGGSVRQDWSLRGTIAVRENTVAGATVAWSTEWLATGDVERSALLGADVAWQPTRWIRLSAGVTQQWLWSTDPTRTGSSTAIALTARVQR
ncbi:MAG: outer membrane beta-barrel protein [Bauldia sp.]|nr:outer membrane beta-barrel protein [Bauldia sp.]